MCINKSKNNKNILHYIQLTEQLSFKTSFPKGGLSYRKQVANPGHQNNITEGIFISLGMI